LTSFKQNSKVRSSLKRTHFFDFKNLIEERISRI